MGSTVSTSPHSHLGVQMERTQSPQQESQPGSWAAASINSSAVWTRVSRWEGGSFSPKGLPPLRPHGAEMSLMSVVQVADS